MKKVGLIVNPIAGLGGYLAEGGSDKPEVAWKAVNMGLPMRSIERATRALTTMKKSLTEGKIVIISPKGIMGEKSVDMAGLKRYWRPTKYEPGRITTREDTIRSAEELADLGVDLLMFSGGDGTAKDVLSAVNGRIVCLGIPAGVKVFSAVFAETPEAAGEIASLYLDGLLTVTEGEVIDVDEVSYRRGVVSPKLYGYLKVPMSPEVQRSKEVRAHPEAALEGIYRYLRDVLREWDLLILGPGSTINYLAKRMGLEKSVTGVDAYSKDEVWLNPDVITMERLAEAFSKIKVVVTPVGGTGVLLGRGNLQLVPILKKIKKEDLVVVATPDKIEGLDHLVVDLDDEGLNEKFRGYIRVITGYREEVVIKVI